MPPWLKRELLPWVNITGSDDFFWPKRPVSLESPPPNRFLFPPMPPSYWDPNPLPPLKGNVFVLLRPKSEPAGTWDWLDFASKRGPEDGREEERNCCLFWSNGWTVPPPGLAVAAAVPAVSVAAFCGDCYTVVCCWSCFYDDLSLMSDPWPS